jgi:hypothetical protein
MMPKFLLPLCLWLSLSLPASAALGLKPDGHLDMMVLRKAYMESEFEKVRGSLEGFLKKHPKDVSREEKIFTHMYLGVICAADSNSQVKAESHFNALLQLAPHIEPVDMFVPPKIQDLFDRIKRDFLKKQDYEKRYDAFGNPIAPAGEPKHSGASGKDSATLAQTQTQNQSLNQKDPNTGKAPLTGKTPKEDPRLSESGSHAWLWWTAGSAAALAVGVGAYLLIVANETPEPNRSSADGTLPQAGP